MIDFKNSTFAKLKKADYSKFQNLINPLLINGEEIVGTYKGIRDGVVFTDKRIISINVQGITGTKKDFTSIPYSKIQTFSVETAGVFDLDSELTLWIGGVGGVKFEFVADADVSEICKIISNRIF